MNFSFSRGKVSRKWYLASQILKSVFWRADKDTTQIRRLARERREYIYRKSLEGKEKEKYEKKRKIWQALQEGKPIPTELREDELEIRKELELEGSLTARTLYLVILISSPAKAPASHVDDEYARAGLVDPKIFITTSRDPSSRLVQFSKVSAADLSFLPLTARSRR